jgi:hypothetical protein
VWWDWFIDEHQDVGFAVYRHTRAGLVSERSAPGPEGDDKFTAPQPGYYSLLWTNSHGSAVTLMVRVPPGGWGAVYPPGTDALASDPCTAAGRSRCVPLPLLLPGQTPAVQETIKVMTRPPWSFNE